MIMPWTSTLLAGLSRLMLQRIFHHQTINLDCRIYFRMQMDSQLHERILVACHLIAQHPIYDDVGPFESGIDC